ncbi:unnamed protein product, partial [Staurois parvus]
MSCQSAPAHNDDVFYVLALTLSNYEVSEMQKISNQIQ